MSDKTKTQKDVNRVRFSCGPIKATACVSNSNMQFFPTIIGVIGLCVSAWLNASEIVYIAIIILIVLHVVVVQKWYFFKFGHYRKVKLKRKKRPQRYHKKK